MSYRLPNGNVTESDWIYYREWSALIKVIGEATGSRGYSFDPGITLYDPDQPNAKMATLPTWFAIRLAIALTEK